MISAIKWVARAILGFFKGLGVTGTLIVLSLAATAALVGYSMWSAGHYRKEAVVTKEALKTVTRERDVSVANTVASNKALVERDAQVQQLISQEEDASEETLNALMANKDWADQPVPAAVLDSLRK